MRKFGMVAALVLGVACYPGDPTSIQDFDTVVTLKSPDYAFSADLTFSMPDTIVQINEDDPDAIDISRTHDAEILAEVRQNLLALGWTEVSGATVPDVVVGNLISATENTTWWITYPPGCWDPYWCYGWYWPPYVGSTSYSSGSYFVVVSSSESVTDPEGNESLPVVWGGAMSGVLASSSQSNFDRLLTGIGQMFEQSPYLSGSSSN